MAVVGLASRITVTVLLEDGQVPLEIVHTKRLIPVTSPFTGLPGAEGLGTEAVPVTTVHSPLPAVGVLAASVADEAQRV